MTGQTFWNDRRILLTGGGGFLGGFLRARIERENPEALWTPRAAELDLRDAAAIRNWLAEHRPNLVIHAAAVVGGIGANRLYPGRFFYENAVMGIHLIEEARVAEVEKFVCIGTVCAYPKYADIPFREDDLWNGYPEETNAPYGVAKKALMVMADAYRRQYGLNAICLLPVNLYGPRDNFDLEMSHVIPAMIRKFLEAAERRAEEVTLWGDGTPTREFLYVDDCVDALLAAAQRYDQSDPVNVGAGFEISVRELAELIARLCDYRGRLGWDTSRPNGQPRRMLDTTLARERFGFQAKISLEEGLRRTIAWYKASSGSGANPRQSTTAS
jgi:GDP-L-fucose synthase